MASTFNGNGWGQPKIAGSVLVDRHWARALGAHQAKGASRLGDFYRIPRREYLKLIGSAARPVAAATSALTWTARDDEAVAALLEAARSQEPVQDSDCVGCP